MLRRGGVLDLGYGQMLSPNLAARPDIAAETEA